jgi:hypothetical protein
MLTTFLPQLIDRVGEGGTVAPGLFNDQAARILGQGSFDHANKGNQWRTFLASDRSRDLSQRAANLPVTDPGGWCFTRTRKTRFRSLFSAACPSPASTSRKQWISAIALHVGIPIPALRAHVGKHIQPGTPRGGPFIVDAHEHNLLTAPALRGGYNQRKHNGICSTISDGLRKARCPHLDGGTDRTFKGVFRNLSPAVTLTRMRGTRSTESSQTSPTKPVISRVTSIHLLDATIWPTQRR